jgi:tetratricopeptide (TPR) repeat protein
LVDLDRGAIRSERALSAKLAFRRGDRDDARARAIAELDLPIGEDEHPWDVAGSYQQFGQILVDLGDAESAEDLSRRIGALLRGAPDDLPLFGHLRIILIGIVRLQGRLHDALDAANELVPDVEGSELAETLRERARVNASLGNSAKSIADYERAVDLFEGAGELWEAERTRTESASGS